MHIWMACAPSCANDHSSPGGLTTRQIRTRCANRRFAGTSDFRPGSSSCMRNHGGNAKVLLREVVGSARTFTATWASSASTSPAPRGRSADPAPGLRAGGDHGAPRDRACRGGRGPRRI
jgi:hypothetical protein